MTIRLWMKTRRKADSGTKSFTETRPDVGCELRPPVTNYVTGESVKAKNIINLEVSSFRSRRQFRESKKMGVFREMVRDGENP